MELKTTLEIPAPYRELFEHYGGRFNEVQSLLLDDVLGTDKSIVLSAPTGSGKTVAFELAVVRMLHTNAQQMQEGDTLHPPKAVYVAPMKALCNEKFLDWQRRFDERQVQVLQITGDSEMGELLALIDAKAPQLVVTTPEKWLSLTRRWHECEQVLRSVRLLMVDEVHLLNDVARGPVLEAVVARMKAIVKGGGVRELRLLVASATIPNTEDLAAWLGAGQVENVEQLVFSDAQRPVPLERHVIGYNSKLKGFQFDMTLSYKLADILRKYAERKPTLIFCNSRKSTEMAASTLSLQCTRIFAQSQEQCRQLQQLSERLHDTKLRKLIACGVAFHHAGMDYDDRGHIEEGFRQGALMVLLATNTLAIGVNLPAHLVVVKSTENYGPGGMQEYSEATILQMIGRAGRPQYDVKGVAVIMTHSQNVRRYENLMSGKMPVESHLHKHLAEHLNSEIVLNTIDNLEAAMNWLRSTYLYVRSLRNPFAYGLLGNVSREFVEHKLEELCLKELDALQVAGLIVKKSAYAMRLEATPYGRLMAKYYLCLETMQLFRQVRGNETLLELLNLLVQCKEFEEFNIRVSEKRVLNALNATPIRFPIAGRVKQREQKLSCLVQATLGNLLIPSAGLAQEAVHVMRIGDRIANCLFEYLHLRHTKETRQQGDAMPDVGTYRALLHAVTIAKCFHARLWENSEFASKQLRKIGAVCAGLFASAGKSTLQSIAETDARTIETHDYYRFAFRPPQPPWLQLLKKPSPFGDELLQNLLQTCPHYKLQLSLAAEKMLQIRVAQLNELYASNALNVVLIVGDSNNNLLLYVADVENLLLEHGVFERTAKIIDSQVEHIVAHVIHPTLVGVDVEAKLLLNEPLPDALPQKATKRRGQTKLNLTSGKRKCVQAQCHNSVLNATLLADAASDTAGSSTLGEEGIIGSLNQFIFNKPKLLSEHTATAALLNQSAVNSSPDILPIGLTDCSAATPAKQPLRGQTKLTNFFNMRKVPSTANSVCKAVQSGVEADNGFEAVMQKLSAESANNVGQSETANADLSLTTAVTTHNCNGHGLLAAATSPEVIDLVADEEAFDCHDGGTPKGSISLSELNKSFQLFEESMLSYASNVLDESKDTSDALVENVNVNGQRKVPAFDLTTQSAELNTSMLDSAICLNTTKQSAIGKGTGKENNVNDENLRFWYNISMRFLRLQPKQRSFENFKKVYKCINNAQSSQQRLTTKDSAGYLPSPAASAVFARNTASSSTGPSARMARPTLLPSQFTVKSALTPRPNRSYRLQLFKEPTLGPAAEDKSSGESEVKRVVSDINRCVMAQVLTQKVEQQEVEDHQAVIKEIEEQVFPKGPEEELGDFEDLYRLYVFSHDA